MPRISRSPMYSVFIVKSLPTDPEAAVLHGKHAQNRRRLVRIYSVHTNLRQLFLLYSILLQDSHEGNLIITTSEKTSKEVSSMFSVIQDITYFLGKFCGCCTGRRKPTSNAQTVEANPSTDGETVISIYKLPPMRFEPFPPTSRAQPKSLFLRPAEDEILTFPLAPGDRSLTAHPKPPRAGRFVEEFSVSLPASEWENHPFYC